MSISSLVKYHQNQILRNSFIKSTRTYVSDIYSYCIENFFNCLCFRVNKLQCTKWFRSL